MFTIIYFLFPFIYKQKVFSDAITGFGHMTCFVQQNANQHDFHLSMVVALDASPACLPSFLLCTSMRYHENIQSD
jgi:hypothetical protein